MASPFSIFRRHKRVSLAVLGVVVMIGFVVLPAIIQMQQYSTGNSHNPTVVKWDGGRMTEGELASKRHTRSNLLRFVQQLQEDARKQDPDVELNTAVGIPNTDDPRSIVQTTLLAEKARQMGIVVSDQTISDYLSGITDGVLTPAQMVAAKKAALGTKWTEEMLFDALREELLAQKVRQMASSAVAVTTPAAAWEYHNRMERQVTAEFVPFPVEEFVKQVTVEPTPKEVKELYEKYKGDYTMPDSPEPGFKQRAKADFQYVVADYNKFLQEEKLKVTQEQIAKYYEDNKNSFRIDEEPAAEPTIDENDPRSATPKPPVPPSEEADRAETPADENKPAEESDPAEEQPEGEPGAQGEAGEAGETAETPAAEEPAAEEPTADKPEDKPADEPKVELPPATTEEGDKPASESAPGEDDLTAPPEREPKYKPLADVEEDIRRQLASAPAEKRLAAAIDAAKQELRQYRDAVVMHQTDKDNWPDPGKFDYKAVAKKHGLTAGDTGLIDALDLYNDKDSQLGQSYQMSSDPSSGIRPQRYPFAAAAFDSSLRPFYPIETQTGGREQVFLSWKVAEEKAVVPPLDEIRDKVVAAWKLDEARKLAKAAAEKYLGEIDSKKPLTDQAGGEHKVLTPPPFTYFNPMSMWMFRLQGQQPQLEEIQGIEDASSDAIKKKVLALPVGGAEVVENAAKSVYYVVRLAGEGNVGDERNNFMQSIVDNPLDGPPPELRYIGYNDQLAVFQDWNEEVDTEFGVDWVDKEYLERAAGRE